MKITVKDVEKAANLAKLELLPEESQNLTQVLQVILAQAEVLKQVETNKVEPTVSVLPLQNVYREDQVGLCFSREEALANASVEENGCFKVPRIV